MAANPNVQKLLETAGKFVTTQKGAWDHEAWEKLVAKVEKLGVPADEEARRNLGNLLEATRHFYFAVPASASKRKRAAKSKTKAKAKSKAKPKPKQPKQ